MINVKTTHNLLWNRKGNQSMNYFIWIGRAEALNYYLRYRTVLPDELKRFLVHQIGFWI